MEVILRLPLVQRLASLHEERHAVPSRVVDEEGHRRERRALATGRHGLVVEVPGELLVPVSPALVLTQHDVIHLDGSDASNHLDLLVADRVGGHRCRRLHRDQRHHLHQVVLDHVTDHAGLFEVAAARPNPDRFCDRDLDVVDELLIPQRFEDAVGKS